MKAGYAPRVSFKKIFQEMFYETISIDLPQKLIKQSQSEFKNTRKAKRNQMFFSAFKKHTRIGLTGTSRSTRHCMIEKIQRK